GVGRLFAGCDGPLAAFATDGALVFATPAAAARLAGMANLTALGVERLAAEARGSGRATGTSAIGAVTVERIGSGAATVLVAAFMAPGEIAESPAPAAPAAPGAMATPTPPPPA